jgi:hypothetical protein
MNQTVINIIALPYLFEIKILSLLDEIISLYHGRFLTLHCFRKFGEFMKIVTKRRILLHMTNHAYCTYYQKMDLIKNRCLLQVGVVNDLSYSLP